MSTPDRNRPGLLERRRFLKKSILGASVGLSIPSLVSSVMGSDLGGRQVSPLEGSVVVFQGDSITDAGRDKDEQGANTARSLGNGYAALAAARLLGQRPTEAWTCYNRGISGNKVYQLAERWEDDCLALSPSVLSILIGVNDFWHKLNGNYDGTPEIYEGDLRALLERTRTRLPDVRFIVGEPFAVAGGTAIHEGWYPDFPRYQQAARRVADAFSAEWIPFQALFDTALEKAPVAYWCPDGVHPALAGSSLMAEAWGTAFSRLHGGR